MNIVELKKEMINYGKKSVFSGLTYANLGNMSSRISDKVIITKTGTDLSDLDFDSFISVDLFDVGKGNERASVELNVHREIYKATFWKAILHVHSPFCSALSLCFSEKIKPVDLEGVKFLEDIPVVEGVSGTLELGKRLGNVLKRKKVAVNKGHGLFACGGDFKEAFINASIAEHSAKLIYIYKTFNEK